MSSPILLGDIPGETQSVWIYLNIGCPGGKQDEVQPFPTFLVSSARILKRAIKRIGRTEVP
jgi:hypothetical protein